MVSPAHFPAEVWLVSADIRECKGNRIAVFHSPNCGAISCHKTPEIMPAVPVRSTGGTCANWRASRSGIPFARSRTTLRSAARPAVVMPIRPGTPACRRTCTATCYPASRRPRTHRYIKTPGLGGSCQKGIDGWWVGCQGVKETGFSCPTAVSLCGQSLTPAPSRGARGSPPQRSEAPPAALLPPQVGRVA